jgi:hypothetical protein
MGVVFRDFLVSLAASAVGDLSSPGYFIALGFVCTGVIWHRKRIGLGKRGVDSLYFIALSFGVAAAAIAAGAYGLGLRSTGTSVQIAKHREPIPEKVVYLKDAQFRGAFGTPWVNPRFLAKFTRSGQRARLFVEDRFYVAGLVGASSWTHAPQVQLGDFKDFVTGQAIDIEILTPFDNDGAKLWRWGAPTEKPDPKTTFHSQAWHQGRLVFLVDGAAPEYFYFVIEISSSDVTPNVIGQERFDFAKKWDAEDAKN